MRYIGILLLCFLISCEKPVAGNQGNAVANKEVSNAWKNDTNGCAHLRNKELAEKLIQDNQLDDTSKSRFIEVFGKPDKEGVTKLTYYFGTVCNGTEIVSGTDTCFAEFTFKGGKLAGQEYICQ
jgi:hypothetical protein